MLSVRNLSASFHTRAGIVRAVRNVSFDVAPGETLGIVGESGSGKSVTCYSIMGLIPMPPGRIESGSAMLDGTDLLRCPEKELRAIRGKRISMIFQDPMASLNERAKVEYIVAEGLLNHHLYKDQNDLHEKVMDALHEVGLLPEFASRFPHEFSGGQRQRIGIARALVMEPEFIVADEPISALDMSIRAQVLNLLLELQEERKLSYLFIAHDLAVVKHISDRVAVMYLGKIVEMSDAETIYQSPKHAYTKALLDAIPEPDPSRANKHQPLPGDVPSPINPPLGSAFGHRIQHPSYPETVGADLTPVEIEPGHWVAPDPCALEPEDWNRIRQR